MVMDLKQEMDLQPWQEQAACWGEDPSLFVGSKKKGERSTKATNVAKRICSTCPVKAKCLKWQLQWEARHGIAPGIFGETTENQRRKMRLCRNCLEEPARKNRYYCSDECAKEKSRELDLEVRHSICQEEQFSKPIPSSKKMASSN